MQFVFLIHPRKSINIYFLRNSFTTFIDPVWKILISLFYFSKIICIEWINEYCSTILHENILYLNNYNSPENVLFLSIFWWKKNVYYYNDINKQRLTIKYIYGSGRCIVIRKKATLRKIRVCNGNVEYFTHKPINGIVLKCVCALNQVKQIHTNTECHNTHTTKHRHFKFRTFITNKWELIGIISGRGETGWKWHRRNVKSICVYVRLGL